MEKKNEQTDKATRKKDAVDVIAWIVIGFLSCGIIWGVVHTVFLGGFADLRDLFYSEGLLSREDDPLVQFTVVLGCVCADLLPAAAGIFACMVAVDKYTCERLTAGAAMMLCIVVPFVAGFVKKLWELFVMIGEESPVVLACWLVGLGTMYVAWVLIKYVFTGKWEWT